MSAFEAPYGVARFTCDGCGKQYRWKAELAGRRVKCAKCHTVMTAPLSPPSDAQDDELYDLVPDSPPPRKHEEYEYGIDGDSGGSAVAMMPPAIARPVLQSARPVAAKPPFDGAQGRQAIGYRTIAPQTARASDLDNYIGDRKKDLYFPAVLLLVGTVIEFIRAMLMSRAGTQTFAYASAYVGISLIINTTVMLIGVLIAAKVQGISFGPVGTAILKLCAISIAPAALSSLLTMLFPGISAAVIGWALSVVLYFALISYLFELDGTETFQCVLILTITRWLLSLFLAAVVYSLIA